jgi:hypothetical protein
MVLLLKYNGPTPIRDTFPIRFHRENRQQVPISGTSILQLGKEVRAITGYCINTSLRQSAQVFD